MYCAKCGRKFSDEIKMCPFCGNKRGNSKNKIIKQEFVNDIGVEQSNNQKKPVTFANKSQQNKACVLAVLTAFFPVFGILYGFFALYISKRKESIAYIILGFVFQIVDFIILSVIGFDLPLK